MLGLDEKQTNVITASHSPLIEGCPKGGGALIVVVTLNETTSCEL